MTHYLIRRKKCMACVTMSQEQSERHCHECRGRRFIESRTICKGQEHAEPMTGGWECYTCGSSGPWGDK